MVLRVSLRNLDSETQGDLQVSKSRQCSDLPNETTGNGKDEDAHDVAD